jgi:hypothetical protein
MLPDDSQADPVTRILEGVAKRDLDPRVAEALERWGSLSPVVYDGGKWLAEGVITYFTAIHQIARALNESVPPGLPAHCFDPVFIAGFLGISVEELHYPQPPLDARLARIESKLDRIAAVEGSGRHPPDAALAPAPRLEVDPDNYRAVLDGQPYRLKSWEQGILLKLIVEVGGGWVSSSEVTRAYPALEGVRLDRQVDALPGPIRALVEAKRGTGYRLRKP